MSILDNLTDEEKERFASEIPLWVAEGHADKLKDYCQLGDLLLDEGLLWIGSELTNNGDGSMSFIATDGTRAQQITMKISECEVPEDMGLDKILKQKEI